MASLKKIPSPITVLIIVTVLAALATWLLPAGEYNKLSYSEGKFTVSTLKGEKPLAFSQHTLDSLHIRIVLEKFKNGDIRKPVAVPGTYHLLPKNSQGLVSVAQAPLKGIYDSVDIIFFILFIGGFMGVFQQTGAMEKGVKYLANRMKGNEAWLIISITFIFSFFGSVEGMAEEAIVFYPVLVPLFLAAGYDLLVPLAVIFGGTTMGNVSSFCNPFATIIASNAAGINWVDGLYGRVAVFVISTIVIIWYIVRYAQKVKKDPTASLVYRLDGDVKSPYPLHETDHEKDVKLGSKNTLLLIAFIGSILIMVVGVVFFSWWLLEMSTLFLVAALGIALITRMKEMEFIESFIDGAKSLMLVAIIVGVARGVTIVLNDGHITDTILYYAAGAVSGMSAALFIIVMLILYMVFDLFIPSSSGMAVLTMPIFGSLAVIVGVPGREIVNAYLYGMGIMSFLTPTGLLLPSLALSNVSLKAWWKFIYPLLAIITVICALFLIAAVL